MNIRMCFSFTELNNGGKCHCSCSQRALQSGSPNLISLPVLGSPAAQCCDGEDEIGWQNSHQRFTEIRVSPARWEELLIF